MTKSKTIIILLVLACMIGGIIYWQYTNHRVAVDKERIETFDVSQNDQDVLADLLRFFALKDEDSNEVQHSIPYHEMISGGPTKDGIPSIDNPMFESVSSADLYLDDDGYGLAVSLNGEDRFYPYQILVWHEIVNDLYDGKPLLITYSPLCFHGAAYLPETNGEEASFGVSGWLWNNHSLLFDRSTESLWSQVLGEAVVGKRTGTVLQSVPAMTVSWGAWSSEHPFGSVLSRNTGFSRDYTRNPYNDYASSPAIWFPLSHTDERLEAKTVVYAVASDQSAKAYPHDRTIEQPIINDTVGQLHALILYDDVLNSVRMFNRETETQTLEFEEKNGSIVDKTTGSVWNSKGEAVEGPLTGTILEHVSYSTSFWFSWAANHPETEVY